MSIFGLRRKAKELLKSVMGLEDQQPVNWDVPQQPSSESSTVSSDDTPVLREQTVDEEQVTAEPDEQPVEIEEKKLWRAPAPAVQWKL